MIRADLHLHTAASPDSLLTPEDLIRACREQGLNCVAVTDHNRLDGALAVARQAPPELQVIAGEEVYTTAGELLGLFLDHEIPPARPAGETARVIRAQGGLVGVPHPCDGWRRALRLDVLRQLWQAGLLDFIEGLNGRSLRQQDNERAAALGRELGLPLSAGSDAHGAAEVGSCMVVMPAFATPEEFLAALARGQLAGRPSPLWARFDSLWARIRRGKKGAG